MFHHRRPGIQKTIDEANPPFGTTPIDPFGSSPTPINASRTTTVDPPRCRPQSSHPKHCFHAILLPSLGRLCFPLSRTPAVNPAETGDARSLIPHQKQTSSTHRITQQPPLSLWSPLSKLCRVAASNTSSTPSPVSEEHSRYFFAPIRRRTSSPSSNARNFSLRLRISSCATGSSRKSFFRPTRMIGTPGQRSRTSGCLWASLAGG